MKHELCRRRIFSFAISFLVSTFAWAQGGFTCLTDSSSGPLPPGARHSCFGAAHTPKGNLHLLIVFVGFNGVGDSISVPNPAWENNLNVDDDWYWPADFDFLPNMAHDTGTVIVPGQNRLFNSDPATVMGPNQIQNLSQYFYQMSDGKFIVTADVYPRQVPVDYIFNASDSVQAQRDSLTKMNEHVLNWIQTNHSTLVDPNGQVFPWSLYDNRTNNPRYSVDNSNSAPDGIIDYVVFIHRKAGDTGAATSSNYGIPGTSFQLGNHHFGSESRPDIKNQYDYFLHEFSHNLFDCPHLMGANGNINVGKYNQYLGWGMMSRPFAQYETANAWERWYLGWMKPDSIFSDTTIVLYDFMDPDTSLTRSIQIPIPGTNGQLLWLENHQKTTTWDYKPFFNAPANGFPDVSSGIMAFVSHDRMGDLSNPMTSPGDSEAGNGLRPYHSAGNVDPVFTSDTCQQVLNASCAYPFDRDSMYNLHNPFSGINPFEKVAIDKNQDGNLRYSSASNSIETDKQSERVGIWREKVNGAETDTYALTGDERTTFGLGDTIGLSGIVPVRGIPDYTSASESNEPYFINGLQVAIIDYDSISGAYTLNIKFHEPKVSKSIRWCGNLIWDNLSDTLKVSENTILSLDLSGTPDRITIDSVTGTFANPTTFSLQDSSVFKVESNGVLIIKEYSEFSVQEAGHLIVGNNAELRIKSGGRLINKNSFFSAIPGVGGDIPARITIEDGGKLIVEEGGILSLERTSQILVKGSGEVIIEPMGSLVVDGSTSDQVNTKIILQDNFSCLRIEGNLEIIGATKFTFTGDGFLALDLPSAGFFQGNITVGTDASFELQGSGDTDKVLVIEDQSYFLPGALESFKIENGKVEMGQGAQLLLFATGDSLIMDNVTIEGISSSQKHNGIFFIEHGNHRLNNLTITDGAPGMGSWQGLNPTGQRLKITNSTFANNDIGLHTFGGSAELVNCNFVNSQKGWQADVAVIPGEIIGGSIQGNADRGIRYFGPGDLHLEDLYLASQVAGLDLYGHSTLTGECVEFASHTGYASLLANGAGADLYPYLGSNYPQWEFNNNNYSILLDSVHHILINDGFTNLRAGASGPNTLLGSQRVNLPPGLSYDASHNRWNTANTSPVSGIDYQVISDLGSITFSDPSPGSVACPTNPCPNCSDENPDGSLPLFACSECQSVSILVDPASSGGEPLEQGYDEHLVEAMRMISTIGSSGSDDEEAAWRLMSLAAYSLSSPNSDEVWLQGIAHRLLLRAMNAAALSGVLTRADSSGLSMDALSTAFVGYLDDQISATSDYSLLAMYQINKAAFLRTLGDRSGSLSEFEDIRSEVSGNDRDMVDQWICLLEYEDDLYTQQIDPVTFWSLVQSCTNGESTSRREAPQSDSKATSILEEFGVKVYPNPATHTLKIEMNVPQETDVTLTLLNANGQLVHSTPQQSISVGEFIWTISTEEFPAGIYLLQINTDAGIESRRVIVE